MFITNYGDLYLVKRSTRAKTRKRYDISLRSEKGTNTLPYISLGVITTLYFLLRRRRYRLLVCEVDLVHHTAKDIEHHLSARLYRHSQQTAKITPFPIFRISRN